MSRLETTTGHCQTRRELQVASEYFTNQGLSQSQIAEKIGVVKSTVCRLQNDDKNPEKREVNQMGSELRRKLQRLWPPTKNPAPVNRRK